MFKNLAKIKPDETIIEHTLSCYRVALTLADVYAKELRQLDTANISGKELFLLTVLLHDTGKYAQPFQNKTLNPGYAGNWGYRHEIFSAEFVNLIAGLSNSEMDLIKLAILSHHNKPINQLEKATFEDSPSILIPGINLNSLNDNRRTVYQEAKQTIIEFHREIFAELKHLINESGIAIKVDWNPEKIQPVFILIKTYLSAVFNYENMFDYEKITFLKGLLVTADHLGSAHGQIDNITTDIYNYYRDQLTFLSTQVCCTKSNGESAILVAPTGTGKTEAALLWTNENLKQNPSSRIFYILPYTASINAMFSRLQNLAFAMDKVDILHGKNTAYYYELIIRNKSEDEINDNIQQINHEIRMKKLSAKSITSPVKIVTPHQIVKNFYGLKHYEEAFLQYYNGLFIFDEIHCYDQEFLVELILVMRIIKEKFLGKFLFMSATFPAALREIIRDELNIKQPIIRFKDHELQNFTRNRLNLIDGYITDEENIARIQDEINSNKRVLIVCNTISKAQVIFGKIKSNSKRLLHSAFAGKDRKEIEKALIVGEKSEGKLKVLVGTQAIEVSLDLDYDCLYTDIASIDALIQRFGRVYRNRKRDQDDYGVVNVFKEACNATMLIYNEKLNGIKFDFIGKTRDELTKLDQQTLDYLALTAAVDNVFDSSYKQSILNLLEQKKEILQHRTLVPLKDYSEEAKAYFDQFDGIKVLPSNYYDSFCQYLEKRRYVDADDLLVTLTERKLFAYYKNHYVRNENILGKNIFVTYDTFLDYDSTIGLYQKKSDDSYQPFL